MWFRSPFKVLLDLLNGLKRMQPQANVLADEKSAYVGRAQASLERLIDEGIKDAKALDGIEWDDGGEQEMLSLRSEFLDVKRVVTSKQLSRQLTRTLSLTADVSGSCGSCKSKLVMGDGRRCRMRGRRGGGRRRGKRGCRRR